VSEGRNKVKAAEINCYVKWSEIFGFSCINGDEYMLKQNMCICLIVMSAYS
jgi:hypothetical protein